MKFRIYAHVACTRCLCDKPLYMSQASTWLTPQGDRVQRRSLHAHTHPLSVRRHAVLCIACMNIQPHAYHASHHVTSLSCQYKCNARRLYTRHSLLYKCTKIDDRYYFRNEQTPNPFPQTTSFRF